MVEWWNGGMVEWGWTNGGKEVEWKWNGGMGMEEWRWGGQGKRGNRNRGGGKTHGILHKHKHTPSRSMSGCNKLFSLMSRV